MARSDGNIIKLSIQAPKVNVFNMTHREEKARE